jgi:GcrA cell cycle regulator
MWTDEKVATLKKLWLEGLSAREVAGQLGGVTRNAVIGKVHRLGLSARGAGASQPRRTRPAHPVKPRRATPGRPWPKPPGPAAPRVSFVEAPPDGPGLIACMTELRGPVCKWPIGDPLAPGFTFCGRRVEGAGPYCPGHHRRAHQASTPSLTADPHVRRLLAA